MGPSATSRLAPATLPQPTRSLAFALGQHPWHLGFTMGVAPPPRARPIPAGDVARLPQEITRAQQRFGLPAAARVVRCYAAGRDGCWLPRSLVAHGIQTHGLDSASIAVKRRQRRAKPERRDVRQRLTLLRRYLAGERKVGSVGRVPSVEEEDRRQRHRELTTAHQARTRGIKRIQGL